MSVEPSQSPPSQPAHDSGAVPGTTGMPAPKAKPLGEGQFVDHSAVPPSNDFRRQLEWASIFGTTGMAAVALITQQIAVAAAAALPLSAALSLGLLGRRRLETQLLDAQRAQRDLMGILLQQGQEQSHLQSTTAYQEQRLEQLQEQLALIQNWSAEVNQGTKELSDYTRILGTEQKQIEVVVGCLREIETYTQAIQLNPNYAKAYYNRALTHQRLGELESAVADYTEALRLNPEYARAYHNRGIARAHAGEKQAALNDLRQAAKYFFEQGDIDSYHKSKELIKRLHDFQPPSRPSNAEVDDSPTLDSFF
jgi:tetratricopeptide (TPR) repeat protein